MRIIVDYIREKAENIISLCDILTKDASLSSGEKVADLCDDYMEDCHQIEKALYEVSERFGDMKVQECVRRFGHIEGQVEPENWTTNHQLI